jgi:glutaredoxin 3
MKMKFTVYSRSGCPYCVKIKEVLELSHLDHVVYNLDEHFTREQFYKEFGEGSTFPQVLLDGEQLGGCADTVAYLINEGYVKA